MKKLLFLFSGFLLAACAQEYRFSVSNNSGKKLERFPAVLQVDHAGFACGGIRVRDNSGKDVPAQWDDLNRNGQFDSGDEIALLTDLLPGRNSFTAHLSGKSAVPAAGTASKTVTSAENGLVRVTLHNQKLALRDIQLKTDGKFVKAAGYFVIEPRMDNSWKWKNLQYKVSVISAGTVRRMIRMELVKEHMENGKKVLICNDLSLFAGRREVLSSYSFLNSSPSQLVQINSVNTGMYQVLPGVGTPISEIRFSGTARGGQEVSGTLDAGGFLLRRPGKDQDIWCDVSAEKCGFAMVMPGAENLDNLLIRYLPKTRSIRMSMLYQPSGAVLWPGKSVAFTLWMLPHGGEKQAVKDFAGNIRQISAETDK